MNGSNQQQTGHWHEEEFVQTWVANDSLGELLEFPRQLAAAIVSLDAARPNVIMDVGSGPGGLLKLMLTSFPGARGIWVDSSRAMLRQAQVNLGELDSRVDYEVADMKDVGGLRPAGSVDVLTNARVAHHFGPAGLRDFYSAAAGLLSPDGWLVTLDHIAPDPIWDARFRQVLPQFAGPSAGKPTHPHPLPYPKVADHLDALRAVGLADCDVVWRSCFTCLVMGRRPAPGASYGGTV